MNYKKGFTLLEILLVVAALSILAGIVILAINPTKQLADTRNAQRWVDVGTILNAVYQYTIDNKGVLPATITTTATEICKTGAASCTGFISLVTLTDSGKYVVSMPIDPSGSATNGIKYTIVKTADGRITVAAPAAEGTTISVTR
jgi:type IV pilus assembly protein PilA